MTAPDPVSRIREGVFFATPPPLPRGRHSLSREDVLATQSERIMIAMTELLGAHGIGGFGPAEIARRAGVSLAAFYDCFPGKEACVFAGYDRFIEVLLGALLKVPTDARTRPQVVGDVLRAYLDTLASDLVVARAYQVEIDALGTQARAQRRDSLRVFAAHLRTVAAALEPDGLPPRTVPDSAYIGMVYAARQLASDALDETAEPDFALIADELTQWLSDTFRLR